MNYNFIFPGQGSQYIGMGTNIFKNLNFSRTLLDIANDILGYNLEKICSTSKVNETKYTQPAIFVYSLIIDLYLKDLGFNPASYSGHSLGEYSALVSSKCLAFEDALMIIKSRANLMNNCSIKRPGKMAAIINLEVNKINKILNKIKDDIVIANYNTPKQIIVSGDSNSIDQLITYFKDNRIKSIIPLNVSGAFHSPLMKEAKFSLDKIIKSSKFNNIKSPIYQNVKPIKNFKKDKIKKNLMAQLTLPVRWVETINNMHNDNNNIFIEVGPGSILSKLNKNINSTITTKIFKNII